MEKKLNECRIDILAFACILFALFSPFMAYKYNVFFSIINLQLWLMLIFLKKRRWGKYEIISTIFYCYVVIMPYITGHAFVGNRYLVLGIFILGGLFGNYYEYTNKWKIIGTTLKISTPFLLYVYIKTFLSLLQEPWSSRLIKNYDVYTIQLRLQGVGGYEFIYFLAMLVNICAGMFFLLKKRKQKWICFLILLLSYIEIILSNFMTALLIATIGIGLAFMIFLCQKNRTWFVFICLCIVFLLIWGNNIMRIIIEEFLHFIPENGKTYARLYGIKDSFIRDLAVTFLGERGDTLTKSVTCFLNHPFMGIIGEKGIEGDILLENVGQHSYFLDTFAFYGGIIGIFSLVSYFSIFRKKYFQSKLSVITIPTMVSGFFLLLVNNVTPSIGVTLGIIYPYAIYLQGKEKFIEDGKGKG